MSDKNEIVDCWACGIPARRVELHHVHPQSAGGADENNIIELCVACHDFIDRTPLSHTCLWLLTEEAKQPAPRWAKLAILKYTALLARISFEKNSGVQSMTTTRPDATTKGHPHD